MNIFAPIFLAFCNICNINNSIYEKQRKHICFTLTGRPTAGSLMSRANLQNIKKYIPCKTFSFINLYYFLFVIILLLPNIKELNVQVLHFWIWVSNVQARLVIMLPNKIISLQKIWIHELVSCQRLSFCTLDFLESNIRVVRVLFLKVYFSCF